jgi:hypothetical protein
VYFQFISPVWNLFNSCCFTWRLPHHTPASPPTPLPPSPPSPDLTPHTPTTSPHRRHLALELRLEILFFVPFFSKPVLFFLRRKSEERLTCARGVQRGASKGVKDGHRLSALWAATPCWPFQCRPPAELAACGRLLPPWTPHTIRL